MPIILGPAPAGSPTWVFDSTDVDASNSPLDLSAGNYGVEVFEAPMPQPDVLYASSVDTEGENPASVRFRNRTIRMVIHCGSAAAVSDLEHKMAKLIREKGSLLYTTVDDLPIIFDIVAVDQFDVPVDDLSVLSGYYVVQLSFTCRPFGYGFEVDLGDNTETSLPWLVFTEASVPGTWPALGRLVVDNDDASNDQWWLVWGIQSRYYSSDASAALGWQAESLTAMGGSATNAGPAGASGSSVMRNTSLATSYIAILSTQATGGGAHMSHVGSFRVFVRAQAPTTNGGTVSLALEWSEGDFRRVTQNTSQAIPSAADGTWRIVDLGLVTLSEVSAGTQQWEGRVLAKSTLGGDDIDIDWLMLVPVDEGSGELHAVQRTETPSTFSIRDDFIGTTSGSALSGRALPIGTGSWATAGAATDFTFVDDGTAEDNEAIQRTTTSDASRRFATAGTTVFTSFEAELRFKSTPAAQGGMILKYVDTTNFAVVYIDNTVPDDTAVDVSVLSVVGGVVATQSINPATNFPSTTWPWVRLWVRMKTDGSVRYTVTVDDSSSSLDGQMIFDSAVALDGYFSVPTLTSTLASGKIGIMDINPGGTAATRRYDSLRVWVPSDDAAIYKSQSAQIRHDRAERENSTGTVWATASKYVGDYLRVPVAGSDGNTSRLIVKASRGIPTQDADGGIDDLSARLYVTPRYLQVPE
jgi:hypothetical protein